MHDVKLKKLPLKLYRPFWAGVFLSSAANVVFHLVKSTRGQGQFYLHIFELTAFAMLVSISLILTLSLLIVETR
jgi:hypothetical protein